MLSPPPFIVYAQACDLCRKMKIKCERKGDECAHCLASNSTCTFAPVERKPPKVKRPELLESMEQRIERMEAILSATDLNKSRATSPDEASDLQLADKFSPLTVNEDGVEKFIGPTSAVSLLSPKGLQWIAHHTSSRDVDALRATFVRYGNVGDLDIGGEWFQPLPENDREPLPKKSIALKYIKTFFKYFNSVYPIFNEEIFTADLNHMYASRTLEDEAWYACLNVVFGYGILLQHGSEDPYSSAAATPATPVDSAKESSAPKAWAYFRNASSNLIDLMLKPDIKSVQALVTMAFMLQTINNVEAFSTVMSAAIQASHRLGLHSSGVATNASPKDVEQRQNTFWLLFILDQSLGLLMGRPTYLQEDDVGVRLPQRPADSTASSSTSSPTSATPDIINSERASESVIFRHHCELALLQNRLQRELYSPRSQLRSQLERLTSLSEIDSFLQSWRQGVPSDIRPGNRPDCSHPLLPHILQLQLAYFDTLACLHRASPFNRGWFTAPHHPPSLEPSPVECKGRVYASTSICANAARSSLTLVRYCYQSGETHNNLNNATLNFMKGQLIRYTTSAVLTLFASTVSGPEDVQAQNDILLFERATASLSTSSSSITSSVKQLCDIASKLVHRSRTRTLPKSKRNREPDSGSAKQPPPRLCAKQTLRHDSISPAHSSPATHSSARATTQSAFPTITHPPTINTQALPPHHASHPTLKALSPSSQQSVPQDLLLTQSFPAPSSLPTSPEDIHAIEMGMMGVSPSMLMEAASANAPLCMPGDIGVPMHTQTHPSSLSGIGLGIGAELGESGSAGFCGGRDLGLQMEMEAQGWDYTPSDENEQPYPIFTSAAHEYADLSALAAGQDWGWYNDVQQYDRGGEAHGWGHDVQQDDMNQMSQCGEMGMVIM